MPRKPDPDGNYVATDTQHYNVRCSGDVVFNRVTARYMKELRADVIEWVWIVEQRREATPKEIARLCAGEVERRAV